MSKRLIRCSYSTKANVLYKAEQAALLNQSQENLVQPFLSTPSTVYYPFRLSSQLPPQNFSFWKEIKKRHLRNIGASRLKGMLTGIRIHFFLTSNKITNRTAERWSIQLSPSI
jgi:hypothetical protein